MTQAVPDVCQLAHPGFLKLGQPVFRLSEGARVPSMVIQLESQEAVLPLRSVAREFRIAPDSADGKMLDLIEQALDFVVALRLGDKLPSELVGGEASWDPNEKDRMNANSRVRYNLVRSVFARTGKSFVIDCGGKPGWEEQSKNRDLLQQAIKSAAELESTDEADITARLASICGEMAYIESMRRILGKGIGAMQEKLLRIEIASVPVSRQDTFKQVQSLARRGLKEIMTRFDDVDLRLDDVLVMLRDMPTAVAWLRRQRDWFFRINTAWAAVFADWASAPSHYDDFLSKVSERTYAFLAPRFMSFQEWTTQESRAKKTAIQAKVW